MDESTKLNICTAASLIVIGVAAYRATEFLLGKK